MSTIVSLKMAQCGARLSAVDTRAIVTADDSGQGWRLSGLRLEITAQTLKPATERLFYEAVAEARRDCPIGSVLNLDVACTAKLASAGSTDRSLSMSGLEKVVITAL
jgi:hypothetical protein